MKRFRVGAYDLPLGLTGVFHLREGDIVVKLLYNKTWCLDRVKWTCNKGFATDRDLDLVPWKEQGVTYMKVSDVQEVG